MSRLGRWIEGRKIRRLKEQKETQKMIEAREKLEREVKKGERHIRKKPPRSGSGHRPMR